MNFVVSERIQTDVTKNKILDALEEQFSLVRGFQNVDQDNGTITIKSGSIFFNLGVMDNVLIELQNIDGGYLLRAHVHHRTSFFFWFFLIVGMVTITFSLLAIMKYFTNKMVLRRQIEKVFTEIKNEFTSSVRTQLEQQQSQKLSDLEQLENQKSHNLSDLEQLEKLATLKDRGIITQEEFDGKKKQILDL